jgi:hypothetical protein
VVVGWDLQAGGDCAIEQAQPEYRGNIATTGGGCQEKTTISGQPQPGAPYLLGSG